MNEFVLDPLARLFGEWSQSLNIYSFLLRIALAVICGFIIGFERSSKRHSAGLRTFLLITLAGCAVGRLDIAIHDNLYLLSAAAVLGAVIVSGNSILFSSKKQIKGLTTSVALWLCLVLGLFAGFGFYLISLNLFILLVVILAFFPRIEDFLKDKSNHFEIHLELKDKVKLQDFIFTLRKLNLQIDDIELNNAYLGSGLSVYTISLTNKEEKKQSHKEILQALSTLEYVSFVEEIK